MKLEFQSKKPNTATVQFRIDPDTKQMLTAKNAGLILAMRCTSPRQCPRSVCICP